MRKVKVVFFLDVFQEYFDGVSNTMHQLVKRLPHDKIEPLFITPHPPQSDIGYNVIVTRYFETFFNKGYRLALPFFTSGLSKKVKNFSPDIVHLSSPTLLGAFGIRYAKRNKLPLSTIYHTHFPTYAEYYLKFIPNIENKANKLGAFLFYKYRLIDRIFAPSPSMVEYLKEHLEIKENQLILWGRGVDTSLYTPEKYDRTVFTDKVKASDQVILFVSRLVKEKETDTLIRYAKLLNEEQKNFKLVVTGDGPDRSRMEKNMPNVIFTGKLTGEALAKIYASADIFLFPSVTETFGNVVLEAMASGLPCLVAAAGGPKDLVKDGFTGFHIEPKNEKEFWQKTKDLLGNTQLLQEMKKNAREFALQNNWETLASQFYDSLLELVDKKDHLKKS